MSPLDQLRILGYTGPDELPAEVVKEVIAILGKRRPGRAVKCGHRARVRILRLLGMKVWPGLYTLKAVINKENHVSPSQAGRLLHMYVQIKESLKRAGRSAD